MQVKNVMMSYMLVQNYLGETTLKISPYITRLGQNNSKRFKKVKNYRKMGKFFKRNFLNNNKFIFNHTIWFFTKYSAFGAILDYKLQSPIPGSRSNEIRDDFKEPYLFKSV